MDTLKRYRWLIGAGAAVLIVAFLLFRPDKLWVDDVVNESLADAFGTVAVVEASSAPELSTTSAPDTIAGGLSPATTMGGPASSTSTTSATTAPPATTSSPTSSTTAPSTTTASPPGNTTTTAPPTTTTTTTTSTTSSPTTTTTTSSPTTTTTTATPTTTTTTTTTTSPPTTTTTTTTTAPPPTTTTTPPGPVIVGSGSFYGINHSAEGTARVYTQNGQYVLRFEDDTDIQNGPDLYVWFLADDAYSGGRPSGYIDLGKLKGNVGGQNYQLPGAYDPNVHQFVLIWCERFSVPFAAAALR